MSSTPGWDARAYDESFRFVSDHAGDLVALLDPQPGERILDLGCDRVGHLGIPQGLRPGY